MVKLVDNERHLSYNVDLEQGLLVILFRRERTKGITNITRSETLTYVKHHINELIV